MAAAVSYLAITIPCEVDRLCLITLDLSDVFLAEALDPRAHPDLPARFALKLACDKRDLHLGHYSLELLLEIFREQKRCMLKVEAAGGHPLIVKVYLDVLEDVPDGLVADAECCSLKMLQGVSASRLRRGYCLSLIMASIGSIWGQTRTSIATLCQPRS